MVCNTTRLIASVLVLILIAGPWPAGAQPKTLGIRIGSSATSPHSKLMAAAICELIERSFKRYNANCEVAEREASRNLVTGLREGELDAAVLGSDWQRGENQQDLRALFALDDQPLTILAHRKRHIKSSDDLQNKHILILNQANHEKAFQDLMALQELSKKSTAPFQVALLVEDLAEEDLKSGPAVRAKLLCSRINAQQQQAKKSTQQPQQNIPKTDQQKQVQKTDQQQIVDAVSLFTAHPNPLVQESINECADLVPLSPKAIKVLSSQDFQYYRVVTIPKNMYKGGTPAVKTVAVGTTLVSSKDTALDKVYVVMSTVFNNFRRFQALYPPANWLDLAQDEDWKRIVNGFRSVPWHPGAAKYFVEVGWAKWFYVIIASFEGKKDAVTLANLLKNQFKELAPVVVRAHNGHYAVSASGQLEKPDAEALASRLEKQINDIDAQLIPTALFFLPEITLTETNERRTDGG